MTSLVHVMAEVCLVTLCLGVGESTGLGVADTDRCKFSGHKLRSSIDPSEFIPLNSVKDSSVSGSGSRDNHCRGSIGSAGISTRSSRRGTKKASIMGLDNLDFVIRTLNRSGNQMRSSIRQGSYYNTYQSGGRANWIGSSGRRSRGRHRVDLINAGKRNRQKTDGGILGVDELEKNENDLET